MTHKLVTPLVWAWLEHFKMTSASWKQILGQLSDSSSFTSALTSQWFQTNAIIAFHLTRFFRLFCLVCVFCLFVFLSY